MANSAFTHNPSITVPGSSTDNAVIRWDGTGGKTYLNSGVIIDDSNVITGITSLTVDNLNINGNTIISTDSNGSITLTPNGSGSVVISKVDINSGDITGVTISGGLTWSAAQNLNSQALTNVNIDSGNISAATISGALTWSTTQSLNTSGTAAGLSTALVVASGGTGLTSYTAGDIFYYASGTTLTKLAKGSANEVLTMNDGATAPEWEEAAGGGDLSFGGDTFGADKVIGSNDAYSLSFETAGVVRMKIHGPVTSPTSAGAITMPYQPAFLAGNSSADNSATGDGTTFTVEFDAEVFDQGGDYNNSTDTFTAPVTGRYCLNATVLLNSIAANHTEIRMQIVTSNRKYECRMGNDTAKPLNMSLSVLADMDAGVDSATVTVRVSNGSNNVEIYGAGGAYETQFGGFLVA